MTLIAFVRHGQSVANVNRILSDDIDNYPLTDEGRKQALNAANELKKISPNRIYTSPVLRAYQTATIIGEVLGISPIVDERLRERGLGELNNKKVNQEEFLKLLIERKDVKGLESWELLKKRMIDFVNSVLSQEASTIVAVTHHDLIKAFLSYILNLDEISAWGLRIPNASITLVDCKKVTDCEILTIGAPILTSDLLSRLKR